MLRSLLNRPGKKSAEAPLDRGTQEQFVARIRRYGDLLLADPSERIAIADNIIIDPETIKHTTERITFYRFGGGYNLDWILHNSNDPIERRYVQPNQEFDEAEPASFPWEAGIEYMRWPRASPSPTSDVRPFLHVLKTTFGELPEEV